MEVIPVTIYLEVEVPIQAVRTARDPVKWELCQCLDDNPIRFVVVREEAEDTLLNIYNDLCPSPNLGAMSRWSWPYPQSPL